MRFTSYENARKAIAEDTPGLVCDELTPAHARAPTAVFHARIGDVLFRFQLVSREEMVELTSIRAIIQDIVYELSVDQHGTYALLTLLDQSVRNKHWCLGNAVQAAAELCRVASQGDPIGLMQQQLSQDLPGIQWNRGEGFGSPVIEGLVQVWDSTTTLPIVRLEFDENRGWLYEVELKTSHETNLGRVALSDYIREDLSNFSRLLRRILDGARKASKKRSAQLVKK